VIERPRERVVAVVQARMSSTRLPGKVLARLGEGTTLELLLHRLRRARQLDEIVVATSTDPSDDPIEREAKRLTVRVLRGSLTDVLDRFARACEALNANAVVRITADCPLIDPEVVDQVVELWRDTGADYISNIFEPRSYPDGLDVEVISAGALRRTEALATDPEDREHVTTYIRRHPDQFEVGELRLDPSYGDVRITLDTAADLDSLTRLIAEVGADASMWRVLEALGLK
jgi:spore coat polysaccharide biosynthesis protein SpsF (cytidylyltransferase family)